MTDVVIITPVLNRKYLKDSMESVLANHCDLIIVNDSKEPLIIDNKAVVVLDNKRNLGIGISRNRGVHFALQKNYKFIGFVDADSILSENWLEELKKEMRSPDVIGASGLALNPNQTARIARIKYLFKVYSRRFGIPFQIDCSLFRRQVFYDTNFGTRRYGEDAFFLSKISPKKLQVSSKAISFHYESDRVSGYFRKELLGALYSLSRIKHVAMFFLLSPWTTMKMAGMRRKDTDFSLAAFVWIFRQLIWFIAFLFGRATNFGCHLDSETG